MVAQVPNSARTNRFIVVIDKLPTIAFQAQTVDMETISIGQTIAPNPTLDLKIPGEKMVYAGLDIGFMCDENYDAYTEGYNYMQTMVGEHVVEAERRMLFTDINVAILNNEHSSIIRTFTFSGCWLESLSPISLDATAADPFNCIATFAFHTMAINSHDPNSTGMWDNYLNHFARFTDDLEWEPTPEAN